MTPDTMRRIDLWIGVPACFVLTIVHRILGLFARSRSKDSPPPRNILLIQLAEMGTMVVMYPAMRKLKELYPDATIHFLCFRHIRPSVEILDAVSPEHIMTIDEGSFGSVVRDTAAFLWRARRLGIDTTINFETFVRYSTILSYLCGASGRVGFHRFNLEGVYCGDFLTHKVMYNAHIHAGHTFLDLVHALGAPPARIPLVKRPRKDDLSVPKRELSTEAREALWSKLKGLDPRLDASKRLVVLNPNASNRFPMRRLPLEDFARLAALLVQSDDVYVLVIGVEEEKPDAAYIRESVSSDRVIDLAGKTSFAELLGLFGLADVLITNDSGPGHFACLTDIHVVVFFGPEIPERYRPLTEHSDVIHADFTCSPCIGPFNQRVTPCNDNLCLQSMNLEVVADLVKTRLLERHA